MLKPFHQIGGLNRHLDVKKIAIIGLLGSLTIILGLTPLGFIPVGPTRATIMHIPVIIGAILYGPLVGGLTGLVFGLFSLFNAIANPTPTSFAFIHPLVSILPRILIGIVAYYIYQLTQKMPQKVARFVFSFIWALMMIYLLYHTYQQFISQHWGLASINGLLIGASLVLAYFIYQRWQGQAVQVVLAAIFGTLTNTVGVMTMIYFLFAERFVVAMGLTTEFLGQAILGVALVNGVPEMILSVLIVTSVVRALKRF